MGQEHSVFCRADYYYHYYYYYRLTRVVPDQLPLNGCGCVLQCIIIMQRVGYKDDESQAQDAEIELAKSNCGVDVYPEFGGERLVGLGEVGVVAVQVVDLNDEVLALGLVLLLQSTRLALQLRLQLHDGALSVLGRTSAAPSVQQQQQQRPFNGL